MSTTAEPSRPSTEPEFRFGFADAGIPLTPEEFDAAAPEDWEEGYRYELIRGVLVVSPFAEESERGPNELLGVLLYLYEHNHPRGSTLDGTLYEQTLELAGNRRRADRVIWAGLGRQPDSRRDVPTIVIEFVAPRRRDWRRDHVEKRDEYLAAGVREYWVIDPRRRQMTVFRPDADERIVPADGAYRTDLLPGFELPLAWLLEAADRWKPQAE